MMLRGNLTSALQRIIKYYKSYHRISVGQKIVLRNVGPEVIGTPISA